MTYATPQVVGAVQRATERASAQVRLELSDGLNGLATVTSLAPWLGLLATIEAIVNSFVGCGEKTACMAATMAGISRAIWPTALGLGIGVIALCGYRTLSATVGQLEEEMKAASRDLVNRLVAYRGQWSLGAMGDSSIPGGILDATAPDKPSWRSAVVAFAALMLAGLLQSGRCYFHDMYPLTQSVAAGAAYTAFVFGVCYVPARLLRFRRPYLTAAVASVPTLIWTALEIALRLRLL